MVSPDSVETGEGKCRLAIPHDTRRLKCHQWLGTEEERQQIRDRRMILCISFLVLLSVGLVLGAIVYLYIRNKTDTQNHLHKKNESTIQVSQFPYDHEGQEPEDRDVIQDMPTQNVSPAAPYLITSTEHTPKTYQIASGENVDGTDHQPQVEEEQEQSHGSEHNDWLAIHSYAAGETERADFGFWGSAYYFLGRTAQAKMMSSYMDVTADPCQDFYQYACGNWGKVHPIPKYQTAYDTFTVLQEKLDDVLRKLLEEQPEILQNDAIMKAKVYFQSCMNYEILEQRAEIPLLEQLEKLGGWPMLQPDWDSSQFNWVRLMAQLRLYNNDIFIAEWVDPDMKNSDKYIIQFDQATLGLPSRDYYLQPSYAHYMAAYKNYLIKIATLLGAPLDNTTHQLEKLISFETNLAKIIRPPEQRRDLRKLYKKMSIRELMQYVPEIDWRLYLYVVVGRLVITSEQVVVFALNYIQDLVRLLRKTPPSTIANYLLWRFVMDQTDYLDDRFQEAKQQFYYVLYGREQSPPRWQKCVEKVNGHLSMPVGAMFVHEYFDVNSKTEIVAMTRLIKESFRELLTKTEWIDTATKELVVQKLDAMKSTIGYHDFILDTKALNDYYKDLVIQQNRFLENTLNILQHMTRDEHDFLGTTPYKSQGYVVAADANAYYDPTINQILLPAGNFHAPFYHRYFPHSLNFGGIGFTIGHEITHGFDDTGRLFDKDGNWHQWWSHEAEEEFQRQAQCFIDQYSNYTVQQVAMNVDGVRTLGDNIADNAGIKQAYKAYQRWANANAHVSQTLPSIEATGHQLFFLNFAQTWCGTTRPETALHYLKVGVHSPAKFRVIGTLSNSEDFASVFKCEPGTPMNPVKKCSVW